MNPSNKDLAEEIIKKSHTEHSDDKEPDEIEILCDTLDSVFLNSYKMKVVNSAGAYYN